MENDKDFEMSVKDFFGEIENPVGVSRTPLSERKLNRKRDSFKDIKIRLVMKLENCTSEEAVRIIEIRKKALRSGEEESLKGSRY